MTSCDLGLKGLGSHGEVLRIGAPGHERVAGGVGLDCGRLVESSSSEIGRVDQSRPVAAELRHEPIAGRVGHAWILAVSAPSERPLDGAVSRREVPALGAAHDVCMSRPVDGASERAIEPGPTQVGRIQEGSPSPIELQ